MQSRALRWGVVGSGLLVAGVACSSFEPDDPATVEPAADGGDSDVAAPGTDAAQGTDAGTEDAAPPDSRISPCAANHLLCDDFDRDGGFPSGPWSDAPIVGGGTLKILDAPAVARSKPSVLRVVAPPNAAAKLTALLALGGNALHCDLDVIVEEKGSPDAILVQVDLLAGAAYLRFALTLGASQGKVGESGALADGGALAAREAPFLPSDTNKWTHVSFDLGMGTKPRFKATVGGADVVSTPLNDLSAFPDAVSATLTVGAATYPGTGNWTLYYDNVVCDSTQ